MTHSFQVGDSVYIIYIKAPTRFTSNYYSTRNKLRIKGIITGTTNGWLKVTIDYLELCKISSKKKKWIEEKRRMYIVLGQEYPKEIILYFLKER
uniref:Uncharacterized protein n=1 Tax=Marseillevirus LCMAC202 TaxID=2506606 RepID=A0A481YZK1_9VIRU|nr:MAG: hypothetical protein LCMAC202_06270 [Marseillevirus LCMAC202]